jgi:hypothetical protein
LKKIAHTDTKEMVKINKLLELFKKVEAKKATLALQARGK